MQSAAIKRLGAAHASIVGMLGPIATIFMGWAILDEIFSAWQLLGAVLVIGGIALLITGANPYGVFWINIYRSTFCALAHRVQTKLQR